MAQRNNRLDRLQIPAPCPADWERMRGDEQVRYCDQCDKYVYNLSGMTRDHAEAVVATAKGSFCARVMRDADGTTLTTERSAGLQLISRRASPVATALVTVMMSIGASAQSSTLASAPVSAYSESGVKKPGSHAQADDGFATLWGTLVDPNEAVIPDATVTLTNVSTGEVKTGTSSEGGEYRLTLLKAGSYALRIDRVGFASVFLNELTLRGNESRQFNAKMEPARFVSTGGLVALPRPAPLRRLYTQSDQIVVARVGETVKARSERDYLLMITTLNVSSTVKGDGKRSKVYLYHWKYQDQKQDEYATGDNLLVFLKKREGEKGLKGKDAYEVDQPDYGAKKLSEADLGAYVQHINELAAIMRQDKPHAEEIVEWLVRCAEDPATRWEGAYDLNTSAVQMLGRAARASDTDVKEDESTDESTEGDASREEADEQRVNPQPGGDDSDFDSRLASYLTAQQKERLAATLFNQESLATRDFSLLDLVKTFNDARLAPFLVSQLRRAESDPTVISGWIAMALADVLKDEEVRGAAQEFTRNFTSVDEEAIKEMDEDANEADGKHLRVKEFDAASTLQQRAAGLREFISLVEKKMGAQAATPKPR